MNKVEDLILNTPKRNQILKEGLPISSQCSLLGRGSFGTVFKAVYGGKPVAVKIVKNRDDVNTMENESHILGWCHQNIVETLKIETTPIFGIVIMERFPGQCLHSILDAVALPLMHRVFITLDILSALSYCHERGLLHLDVKPHNILVACKRGAFIFRQTPDAKPISRRCVCKLCDFGSSMRTDDSDVATSRGIPKGTVRYMSPEALRDEKLSSAADIYSLGITMWHMQHRRMPYFWIESNDAVAYQVVKKNLRPDAESCPKVGVLQHSDAPFRNVLNRKRRSNKENDELQFMLASKLVRPTISARRIFQDANAMLKRTLCTNVEASVGDANVFADRPNWTDLFQNIIYVECHKTEAAYGAIVKSCWNSDCRRRPNAMELRKQLEQLLM